MDFNFLKNVEKTREKGQSAVRKTERGISKTSKRKRAETRKKRAMKKAKERGVDVRDLPAWMERAKQNKIKWDSEHVSSNSIANMRNECILWTVEWRVNDSEQTTTVIENG